MIAIIFKIKVILLQTASTEMDVVTVATEASQFPGTLVSRGAPNAPINTISTRRYTKKLLAIYVVIQEGTL